MIDPVLTQTRRTLHAVAELVLAGPSIGGAETSGCRFCPGGFRTVTAPDLRVIGTAVVADGQTHPIGGTAVELGAAVGVAAGGPADVYPDGCGVRVDDELVLNPDAARTILDAYETGDAALRLLAPDEEPILWPEHFDVGIRVDNINFGTSPGDGFLGEPYAHRSSRCPSGRR